MEAVATENQVENQKMIAEMVRDFAKIHITPFRNKWDDEQYFPIEVFKELGKLGLMGVLVPQESVSYTHLTLPTKRIV